ncbi:TetR/AcrR family transcriptional regulator [Paenibacillus pseudetheri]|uniref:HTH tetR-type domain-containing protein n=1 Tax=Paenibacillus pseudetheri TaxID=2897682 RepID=A0ABN8FMN1_9BACL|nr:TetR-like C-terminal domain-containing protein [Paenibacillus pseudetheri]CAH1059288.1 hypothetical protein PAECIP111894_05494 [Paenibacillus pseudetheri]
MKKKPEVTAVTKEKLMASFWKFYCGKKIEKITVKEITDEAGYYRSTFYDYFTDIYDVLEQLETGLIHTLKENVQSSLVMKQQNDIIKILATMYEERGEYLSVLLGKNGDPNFHQKLKDSLRPMLFEEFGLPKSDMDIQLIIEFGMAGIISTITYWYDNGKRIPNEELAIMIRSMLLEGTMSLISKRSSFDLIERFGQTE